jgi:hypothetical protein
MYLKETWVTPDQALKWLEEDHVYNRKVRQTVVAKYARDMAAGNWRETHEAIAFDPDGKLIDGQHRLWAIVESKIDGLTLLVAKGVDRDAQAYIDSGLGRTMADRFTLSLNRADITNAEIAVAKALIKGNVRGTMTAAEVFEAYSRHEKAITFGVKSFTKKVRGVTVVPIYTVLTRAWYTQPEDKLRRFIEILTTGMFNDTPGETSALLLRNWLLERNIGRVGGAATTTVYNKTERALSAFIANEQLSSLYPATTELFPLPTEKVSPKASRTQRKIAAKIGTHVPDQKKVAASLASRRRAASSTLTQ